MKFKKGLRRKAIEYEKDLIKYWHKHKTFERSVTNRPEDNAYVFYDGPPFITGEPHHGTLLSSVVKDAVPRYQTMKGKRVERQWGWDCHGLPAEVFTEKKLGITKREQIDEIGLEKYITTCRDNMVLTGSLWEDTINRIGRWVNFKGAYKTMDKDYMESVWWAFKALYEKGKIYEGEKVLLYCPHDATPISKAEVAMDNSYQDVSDPSVYVKFKLKSEDTDQVHLLAWTTTPWTLLANTAIVVNKQITYCLVEVEGNKLILAKNRLDNVLTDEKHQVLNYKIIKTFKGSDLVGKSYEPLFKSRGNNAHKIWHGGFVSEEEGTGVAHMAPAYGEDDYLLAQSNNIPIVSVTDDEAKYTEGNFKGQMVWDANKQMAKELKTKGDIWKIDYIMHSYPHCHRCGTKLIYRAHPSWFMDIAGQKQLMLEQNGPINWFPDHIKHGRFEKTVQSAPDWNISRDRFWATAMPVWKGIDKKGKEHTKVIGSYQELKELSGKELDDYHRPWIDDVKFTINNIEYKRIDKVLDCWFESGSMPFAQFHYPFENKEKFENNFPGDFIAEYVGQVRAWFYYLHAINVGLFEKNSFTNVIVTGTLAGSDGRKMSKSYGNYTDPNELMDKYSADSLRLLYFSSPLLKGEDFSLKDKDVASLAAKLNTVWNMYDFFTLYAEVDGWEWNGKHEDISGKLSNPMDQWIVSKAHQLTDNIDEFMQNYDIMSAVGEILPFIDDASNWYVRRSRRRFWKSGNDQDKHNAYNTLHYILVRLSQVMAPFTPFLAEELYQKLTGEESVHLTDWPQSGKVNRLITDHMDQVKWVVNEGLSQRAGKGIKVRQPLSSIRIELPTKLDKEFTDIIAEELNVKTVDIAVSNKGQKSVELNTKITDELKREGIMREIVRNIQNARKEAGLDVDNRINLVLKSSELMVNQAVKEHKETIMHETLAKTLEDSGKHPFVKEVEVYGHKLEIKLSKA